jgi:predicted O-linked N-acetylglucosamine transferase (SPINDLY family)
MGADFMDYLVADHTLIPPQSQVHYTEKIAYLPHSYQVNDAQRQISDRVFTREVVGLPPTGFVFCCFNNNYKITPDTFDGWMRILQAVPDSVLWLLADNPTAAQNLSDEAELRGVSAKRLVFAPRLGLAEHLARHRLADLFIDTLPCNAHTTASDALWAELPVLTQTGEAFASRVAASLLHAVGLPELVTDSQEAYEALAIELAQNPEKLQALRQKLSQLRLPSPLFDTPLYTQHLQALYTLMHQRAQDDLPAEHLYAS